MVTITPHNSQAYPWVEPHSWTPLATGVTPDLTCVHPCPLGHLPWSVLSHWPKERHWPLWGPGRGPASHLNSPLETTPGFCKSPLIWPSQHAVRAEDQVKNGQKQTELCVHDDLTMTIISCESNGRRAVGPALKFCQAALLISPVRDLGKRCDFVWLGWSSHDLRN